MLQFIAPGEALRRFQAGEAVPVDVRSPTEYASGHIPGAVLLPVGEITAETALATLPSKEACLVVYCRSGSRAAQASYMLMALGYRQVYDLGGLLQWPYALEDGQ